MCHLLSDIVYYPLAYVLKKLKIACIDRLWTKRNAIVRKPEYLTKVMVGIIKTLNETHFCIELMTAYLIAPFDCRNNKSSLYANSN